jgi:hypothetical protein
MCCRLNNNVHIYLKYFAFFFSGEKGEVESCVCGWVCGLGGWVVGFVWVLEMDRNEGEKDCSGPFWDRFTGDSED